MRTKPRVVLALGAGLLALGFLAGCTSPTAAESAPEPAATTDPAPTPARGAIVEKNLPVAAADVPKFCGFAARLALKDPQAAIDLIDSVRAPAKETLERDETLSSDQALLLDACADVRLSAAAQVASDAIESAVGDEAEEAEKAEEKADKTPAEKLGEAWADVVENWFTPLTGLALLVGVTIVVLLVLARFASLVRGIRNGLRYRWARRVAFWVGLGLIVFSSFWTAKLLTRHAKESTIDGWPWIAGVVAIGLVGSVIFAKYLAARLSLKVVGDDAKGESGDWTTARIVAALSSMGAKPSRRLEIPTGSDIDELSKASLPGVPTNKVLEVIQSVIGWIFLGTPWRIKVIQDGEKRATVSAVHNGESVLEQVINLDDFKLPEKVDKQDALITLASAAILIALSRRHQGFEGLAGTENYGSFGVQVLAARLYRLEDPDLATMLKRAVALDPGNHVASFMLQNALHRDSIDPEVLAKYYRFLVGKLAVANELKAEELADRSRLLASIMAVNIRSAPAVPGQDRTQLLKDAAQNVVDVVLNFRDRRSKRESLSNSKTLQLQAAIMFEMLRRGLRPIPVNPDPAKPAARENIRADLLEKLKEDPKPQDLQPGTRDEAIPEPDSWEQLATYHAAGRGKRRSEQARETAHSWIRRTVQSEDPNAAYNVACFEARLGNFKSALASLEVAATNPYFRDYARKDRDLRELSLAYPAEFLAIVRPSPRKDAWELEPFASLKSRLEEAGIPSPGRLVGRTDDRYLAEFLETKRAVLVRLHNLARLIKAADDVALTVTAPAAAGEAKKIDLRVELISALMDAGVEKPEDIPREWTVAGTLKDTPIRESATAFKDEFGGEITDTNLAEWLSSVRAAGVAPVGDGEQTVTEDTAQSG